MYYYFAQNVIWFVIAMIVVVMLWVLITRAYCWIKEYIYEQRIHAETLRKQSEQRMQHMAEMEQQARDRDAEVERYRQEVRQGGHH
jgi:hypothetical protein